MENSNAQKHPEVTPEAVNVTSGLRHPSGTHTGVCTGICAVSRATAKTNRGTWRDVLTQERATHKTWGEWEHSMD